MMPIPSPFSTGTPGPDPRVYSGSPTSLPVRRDASPGTASLSPSAGARSDTAPAANPLPRGEPAWNPSTFSLPGGATPPPYPLPPGFAEAVRLFETGRIGMRKLRRALRETLRAHAPDWRTGWSCIDRMMQCRHRDTGARLIAPASDFAVVLAACSADGKGSEALHILQAMESQGNLPDDIQPQALYASVMAACVSEGLNREALELFDRVAHPGAAVQPNFALYECAQAACQKGHFKERMVELFERRLQDATNAPHLLPRLAAYEHIAEIYRRTGRPHDVLRLFQHMLEHHWTRGVWISLALIHSVIAACEDAGWHDHALQLLDWAVRLEVLRPELGLDARSGQKLLRLQIGAVAGPRAGNLGLGGPAAAVHPGLAQTIFRWHLRTGGIDTGTRFVVGQLGADALRNTIVKNIWRAGCYPAYPTDPGSPRTPLDWGCLVALKQAPFPWHAGRPDSPRALGDPDPPAPSA